MEEAVEATWRLEPLPLPEDDVSNDSLDFSTIGRTQILNVKCIHNVLGALNPVTFFRPLLPRVQPPAKYGCRLKWQPA